MKLDIILKDVFSINLDDINLQDKILINTINPHSYCVALKDEEFKMALENSDILLPDGSGIVLATKILTGKKIAKIAGADIHQYLLEQANLNNQKVFYLGASQNTLNLIEKRLEEEFPKVKFKTFSPPYKEVFSSEESRLMIQKVNAFQPDILFVGMTAPKQEKWLAKHFDQLNINTAVCIGAVFDFYAGTVKRSSPFWINLGLEWLPRLIREPRRLWKRNFVSTPLFLWFILKAKLGLDKTK